MRILAAVIFCLFNISVMAGEATLSWKAPTGCANGGPITDCPLTAYEIERAVQSANPVWASVLTVAPTLLTYKFTNIAPGKYLWRIKAASGSNVSVPSNVAAHEVLPSTPTPPIELKVIGDTTAFQLNGGTNNKIYFTAVGSVPPNTPCNRAFNVMDKYMIANRNVATLKAGITSRPRQIYAWCG